MLYNETKTHTCSGHAGHALGTLGTLLGTNKAWHYAVCPALAVVGARPRRLMVGMKMNVIKLGISPRE